MTGRKNPTRRARRHLQRHRLLKSKVAYQSRLTRKFDEEKQALYGGSPSSLDESGVTLGFQNINGIWTAKRDDMIDALGVLDEMTVNYMGTTEVNVNSRNVKAETVRKQVMQNF